MEQRRTKRFDLSLPVEVLRAGSVHTSRFAKTRNISSGGVLLLSPSEMEIGGPVEYVITLSSGNGNSVNLRCLGKVLRQEPLEAKDEGGRYSVAVSLERYEFTRSFGLAG